MKEGREGPTFLVQRSLLFFCYIDISTYTISMKMKRDTLPAFEIVVLDKNSRGLFKDPVTSRTETEINDEQFLNISGSGEFVRGYWFYERKIEDFKRVLDECVRLLGEINEGEEEEEEGPVDIFGLIMPINSSNSLPGSNSFNAGNNAFNNQNYENEREDQTSPQHHVNDQQFVGSDTRVRVADLTEFKEIMLSLVNDDDFVEMLHKVYQKKKVKQMRKQNKKN